MEAMRMKPARRRLFEDRARVLKALAHPTRLFLVDAVSRRSLCVCELTDLVGADVTTVSKHLSILQNAGILRAEKRGPWVHYSLRCACALAFFGCIDKVLHTISKGRAR
jgi:DNA-binding transcriptional ArsR family regulator